MKATEILNKAKELLSIQEEEVKLAQANLENGTVIEADEFAEGKEVFIVTEDERVALPVGDYTLEDGQILIVEEEGIIASIGAAEEAPAEEEVEAEQVEAAEEEMEYATKAELSEIKEMVEEIKAMLEPKEEMSADKLAEEAVENIVEEVKEELSEVERVNHNPEASADKALNLYSQKQGTTTFDRVLAKFNKFNK